MDNYRDSKRYGQWYDYDESSASCSNWKHVPKEKFPKEFLTNLLLLGLDVYEHTSKTKEAC